jgi:hypothetical protein
MDMTFDLEKAELARMASLGADSPSWLRYLRIRDWVVKLGGVMGMEPADELGWRTFVLTMEAFPEDEEPADQEIETEATAFLREWMAKGQPVLLDSHEAVLMLDELMEQERIPADEALDRMGNLKALPFSDEVMAGLIAVVPQPEPDYEAIPEDVLGDGEIES